MNDIVSTLLMEVGFPAGLGFVIGYTLKKIAKIALAIFGIFLLALYYLQMRGIVAVNTEKLTGGLRNITASGLQQFSSLINFVVSGILPAGSFVAGFALGLKKG